MRDRLGGEHEYRVDGQMVSAANTQRERSSREMASGDHCERICATCPVASQCLEYALENHVDTVSGAAAQNESRVASFANVAVGAYSTLTLPSAPFACSSACFNISEGRNHDLLETLRATAGIFIARPTRPISSHKSCGLHLSSTSPMR